MLIIEKLSVKTGVFFLSVHPVRILTTVSAFVTYIDEYVWHVNECGCCCKYNTTRASSCIYFRLFPHIYTYAYIWRLRKVILFQLLQLGNTWSEAITLSMFPGSGSTQCRWDGKCPEASGAPSFFNVAGGKNSTFFFQLHEVVEGQKQFHSVYQWCALDKIYTPPCVSNMFHKSFFYNLKLLELIFLIFFCTQHAETPCIHLHIVCEKLWMFMELRWIIEDQIADIFPRHREYVLDVPFDKSRPCFAVQWCDIFLPQRVNERCATCVQFVIARAL